MHGTAAHVVVCVLMVISGVYGGYWGPWRSWTTCNKTCSKGTQLRWRICLGIGRCYGESLQQRSCFIKLTCQTTAYTTTTKTSTASPTTHPATSVDTTTPAESCYDSEHPENYRGKISITESGKECQPWESQTPRQHKYTPDRYPNADLKNNYCRNPDHDPKPWCITSSGDKYWEFCSIPDCSATTTTTTITEGPLLPATCGVIAQDDQSEHIVGGQDAEKAIPWQVSLRNNVHNSHFCGGSIISNNWIVTASHCFRSFDNPSRYYAILGDYHRFQNDGTEKTVRFSLTIGHEKYRKRTFENDIALLKMTKPLSFTPSISPICLPEKGLVLEGNTMVTVSGWGSTKGTGDNDVLRKVDVPVVSQSYCRSLQSGILDTMMCAGYLAGGKDACQGDSGGPLFRVNNDRTVYELIGIVSWGYGCAEEGYPGVYTRVSNYIDWIDETMRKYR